MSRFLHQPAPEPPTGPGLIRDDNSDMETGVVGQTTSPEVRAQALFRDRFVGVVRKGHPLARGKVTPARYTAAGHVRVARPGTDTTPIDEALAAQGMGREIVTTVTGYTAALAPARASDLVPSVPERATGNMRADAEHRWIGGTIRAIYATETDSDAKEK